MSRLELFATARERAQAALEASPFLFPLESVIAQLDYLIAVEEGTAADLGPLQTMDLGQIAARDIEGVDRDLANMLHSISAEVRRMLASH
jgi:hypothetical protein